jgi:pimeloyl-ACP methyl ester carboxylesterase
METIRSTDGTPIAYWRTGEGEPLLLVHGTTCDHAAWTPMLSALERHFSVYVMDRRGRGNSGDSPDYALERESEDIASVIDAIGGGVNVVGHSYGALCSLGTALLSANVRRLILYEPPMAVGGRNLPPGSGVRMQAFIDAGEKEQALLLFLRDVFKKNPQEIASLQATPEWTASFAIAHTILRECQSVDGYTFDPQRFRSMQTPLALLVGADSPAPQHSIAATVYKAWPNSRIVLLPGQEHFATITAPELVAQEVISFLTESTGASLHRAPA